MASEEMDYAARLARLRWGDDWCCPRCGDSRWTHLRSRPRVYQCKSCRKHCSVTAGTILHGTKLALADWFRALDLFCSAYGVSVRELADELSVPVKTAFEILHRIRKAVDVAGPPLAGATATWLGWIKCSRPPRVEWRLPALSAMDEQGRLFFHAARADHHDALADHSPEATPESEPAPGLLRAALAGATFVLARLRYTHRQVSQRYLARYLRTLVYQWHTRRLRLADAVEAVAYLCVVSPAMTFASLRPPLPIRAGASSVQ